MRVDWQTLTRQQAARLVGAANRAEQAAAARFGASGSDEDEAAMLAAFTLWEDLRVYVICGEKPGEALD